jgi:hypothetical protein
MIRSRGYSTKRFKTLHSAYYNKPTHLQQVSHDVYLINLVHNRDSKTLTSLLSSGISPNPCNKDGESLVHMICRRGEHDILEIFMKNNCSLQVSDDYGRTPLHDACWAARPALETVKIILEADIRLLHMTDCRGAVPLSYVCQEHWGAWISFLDENKDVYWPKRDLQKEGEEDSPALTLHGPWTRPVPNPPNALIPVLAAMVASGRMEPYEAELLKHERVDFALALEESWSHSENDRISDSAFAESTFDEGEMADIMALLSGLDNYQPVCWSAEN